MLIELPDAAPEAGTLNELAQGAPRADAADTLVVLGANPAYDAPGSLDIAAALSRARFSVHAGLYADGLPHAAKASAAGAHA
ncbi:MAG: hypothetical protein U1F25_08935 [Rubrivivax sp.]